MTFLFNTESQRIRYATNLNKARDLLFRAKLVAADDPIEALERARAAVHHFELVKEVIDECDSGQIL